MKSQMTSTLAPSTPPPKRAFGTPKSKVSAEKLSSDEKLLQKAMGMPPVPSKKHVLTDLSFVFFARPVWGGGGRRGQ